MIFLFIALAAGCKAVADTLAHHFYTSVFRGLNPRYWDPSISWQYVGFVRFTKYRPDAWHLANSGMIVCFVVACCFPVQLPWYLMLPAAGVVYNIAFNICYNHLLKARS